MHQQVEDIFDDRIVLLRAKSFYDDFYIKEGDIYIYIYYIPFVNFRWSKLRGIWMKKWRLFI